MVTHTQTINESRGARRAAELRRRFAHVSNASRARSHFGLRPGPEDRSWNTARSRRAQLQEFLSWTALAAVVVVIGIMLFRAF